MLDFPAGVRARLVGGKAVLSALDSVWSLLWVAVACLPASQSMGVAWPTLHRLAHTVPALLINCIIS